MNALIKQILKKPHLSIFLITLVIFIGLQYKEAITNYTTRFVEFADYMLHHGVTLFPISSNSEPYPDYTIANTFLIYLFSLPFGRLSIVSMGLPYCITAALTLVFIYKLGALHDKKWGLYGVLFALFTWVFLDSVNSLALDVYPTFMTVLCFYLAYSAELKKDKSRLIFLFFGLILGFIFRGPIGLTSPAVVVGCYYLINKQWRTFLWFSLVTSLILMACIALLAWTAYLQGGTTFMQDVLTMQGLGRIVNDHTPRYYFYFSGGLITYSITVFFALAVIAKKYKQFFSLNQQPDTRLLLCCTVWFLVLIVLFTIPYTKKARYVLPITPAISLLAAYIFIDKGNLFTNIKKRLLQFCFALPIIGLAFVLFTLVYNHYTIHPLLPNYPAAIVSFAILLAARYVIKKRYAEHPHYELITMLFGVTAFLLLDAFFFNPVTYHLELAQEDTPKFLPYWLW